jgi:hypothetical protein
MVETGDFNSHVLKQVRYLIRKVFPFHEAGGGGIVTGNTEVHQKTYIV